MPKRGKEEIRILVVDDEPGMRDLLSFELGSQGYQVFTADDGLEAIAKVRSQPIDLVISDIKMPKMDGVTALEEIKRINPAIEVIMATGFGTIETAVTAMKKGAYDFVQKPYDIDEIGALVEKALEKNELKTLIALYESSRAIFSMVKLKDLMELVMDLMQKTLRADEGSIMFLDDEKKIYIANSRGIDEEIAKKVHLEIGERVAGWVAEQRRELLLVNGLEKYPEFKNMQPNPKIGSSILVPLVYRDELLGVLTLNRLVNHENFNSVDLSSASLFGSQVVQAVQNAKLFLTLENKVNELKTAYKILDDTKTQLVESEKLAAIGRLVAGVAHEINNPLTSVLGYTELLLNFDEVSSFVKEDLSIIFNEAQRCRKIVQNLLIFARRQKPTLEPVSMSTIIDEMLSSLSLELIKGSVQVLKNYQPCPNVYVDRFQMQQVFLNLIKNAVQALENVKGARQIEISVSMSTQKIIRLIFSDNGPGIPGENIKEIFEPFFTTKGVGKGTGLGLSLSYGIIQQHGGTILVESELGKGVSFIIEIPAITENEKSKGTTSDAVTSLATDHAILESVRGKKILVIDDEEPIRFLIQRVLLAKGFQVEMVVDGEAAVAMLKKKGFDLILCDYMIPKINGIGVYEEIKKVNPSLAEHFIFVSGCSADKVFDNFLRQNNILRITKPFMPEQLINTIVRKLSSYH